MRTCGGIPIASMAEPQIRYAISVMRGRGYSGAAEVNGLLSETRRPHPAESGHLGWPSETLDWLEEELAGRKE